MIGSGQMISEGERDFQVDFRNMVETEKERAPEAILNAKKERPSPSSFVVKVQLTNLAPDALTVDNQAMLHIILYQGHRALQTGRDIVRSHEEIFVEPLEYGFTRNYDIEFTGFRGVNLSQVEAVAFVDYIPPDGDGRWNMLQGAKAVTKDLPAIPDPPKDEAPVVANPIANQQVEQGADPLEIDVSDVFTDSDDPDEEIEVLVTSVSDEDLITATMRGRTLTLEFDPDRFGEATVFLRGTSDGQFATTSFDVEVTEKEEEPNVPEPPIVESFEIFLPWLSERAIN